MSSLHEESDPSFLDETIVRPRRALLAEDAPPEQMAPPRQRLLQREDWGMLTIIALTAISFGTLGGFLFWLFAT